MGVRAHVLPARRPTSRRYRRLFYKSLVVNRRPLRASHRGGSATNLAIPHPNPPCPTPHPLEGGWVQLVAKVWGHVRVPIAPCTGLVAPLHAGDACYCRQMRDVLHAPIFRVRVGVLRWQAWANSQHKLNVNKRKRLLIA